MEKIFSEKIKVVDVIIAVCFILALGVGFLTYRHFRQTAGTQIEANSKAVFQVYLRGVTITRGFSPIKPGDETFISIRNVPYTNLRIIEAKIDTKKTIVATPNAKKPFMIVDDYSQMFMYDVIVTVIDNAKVTRDGVVVGGNKIKIGMPITLEGKDYKFNGTVSDIELIPDDVAKKLEESAGKQLPPPPPQQPQPQAKPGQPAPPQPVNGQAPQPVKK